MSELLTAERTIVRRPRGRVPQVQHAHVLIADSNDTTRETREQQLRAVGFRVSLARTAFEAIVKATCHLPDVILLDGALSDIDASETGQLLTTCPVTAHIPVVRLTAGRPLAQRVLSTVRRLAAAL